MRLLRVLTAMGILSAAGGCQSNMDLQEGGEIDIERASDPAEAEEAELRSSAVFDAEFEQAAEEFNVPAAVLKSLAFVNTRYEMVVGETEFEGREPAFGVMALEGARLVRGAELAGVTVEQVKTEPLANIRAAAALLNAHAHELNVSRSDVRNWAPAVAKYSGIEDVEAQRMFVRDEVFSTLKLGVGAPSQQLLSMGQSLELDGEFATATQALSTAPDYSKGVWRPSPNYNARPAGTAGKPAMVIIHTCEGSYTSCWSWLTNRAAGASAHYVINTTGSEISQLVRESARAWHIGASYACSRNSGVDCWRNGSSSNNFTVGIEHAGFASQKSFPAGQIDASARLTCNITKKHGIARDRYHIVGHGQLQPYNRTDPGPNWPWTSYLQKVNSFCAPTPAPTPAPTGGLVIDSNNSNNNKSKGYIQVSANWKSSNSTAGYYGTGYYFADTAPVSDGATFWFYMPAAGTRTIDAWWTAGTNRAPSAPFVFFNAAGAKLGTKFVNQQVNGKKWNTLGTYNFSAGWNKVVLSRWTTNGKVVLADAIRVR